MSMLLMLAYVVWSHKNTDKRNGIRTLFLYHFNNIYLSLIYRSACVLKNFVRVRENVGLNLPYV